MKTIITALAALVSMVAGTVPCAMAGWQLNGIPVGPPAGNQFTPSLIPNGNGAVSILWREEEPGGSSVFGTGLTGYGDSTWFRVWSAPTGVLFFPGPGTTAPDGAGGEIAVWNTLSGGSWDIVAQRIDINGNLLWGPDGVLVCAAPGSQEFPRLIADGAGGAFCAWVDGRSGPSGDIYVQHMNASGNMLWTSNGVAACVDWSQQWLGSLLTDNAGGVVLAWNDLRNSTVDIYVQRIDGAGNALWAANGIPFVTTSANENFGQMVASGPYGAIITWVVATPGPPVLPPPWPPVPTEHYEVFTRRLDFVGSPDWPGSVPVCVADGSRYPRAAVSDGAGGAIIALYDNRYGNTDVFLSRIDLYGNRVWGEGGVALCTAAGEQLESAMVADGAGGAMVAWSDHRDGPAADIYAGHVDALGNALWTQDGIPVCTAVGNQSNPDMAPDGAGGVAIVWEDARTVNSLVFAQRLNATTGEWGSSGLTGVGTTPAIPGLGLVQNHPNPFGATTDIEIDLPDAADVSIEVYDVAGRRVYDFALNHVTAGRNRIPFAGRDHDGRPLASGVYFYRVKAAGQAITRKMVITR